MKKEGKILIVDDNIGILKSLKFALKFEFEKIDAIKNPNQIPNLIQSEAYDIILLDMNFVAGINTGNEGIFWLRKIIEIDCNAVVILITAYGDIDLAVKAIREGAIDFVLKPWDNYKLISTLKSALKLRKSKLDVKKLKNKQQCLSENLSRKFNNFTGESETMQQIFKTIDKVAKTDANVLILGENGTGKELVAHEIHKRSNRANEVFIGVDMGALSETLFESELFGHIKGAFTDAKEDRIGRFENASGGTLFLDEIGNLSIKLQTKLLTAIQNRIITPLGSSKEIKIDIRLICATNKPIYEMVNKKQFREDLVFRINTIQIDLPPLRERDNDIILLANQFLIESSKKYNNPSLKLTKKAEEKLLQYNWPGNVRELKHTIEKTVIMCDKKILSPDDFLFRTQANVKTPDHNSLRLEDVERKTIEEALTKNKGNLSKTAKELGITRKTLYVKIKKYGL